MAPRYTEEMVQEALALLKKGWGVNKAARKYGIPPTTLRHRRDDVQPRKKAYIPYQRISEHQETTLANWIRTQAALGFPVTHAQIRELVQRLSNLRGDPSRVGKRWVAGFLARNPGVGTKKSKRVDAVRLNGATKAVIEEFFELLDLPQVRGIKPENRYNKDEMGLMEGQGTNGKVLGDTEEDCVLRKQPGSRAWTSFIECISATGVALPPLIIWKGRTVQDQHYPEELEPFRGWNFTYTDKGWTNNSIALEWLLEVFIPLTKPANPSDFRLLIVDGHGSHTTDDYMWNCFVNKIYLLFLPPHCSHVVQPLDLGVFAALKTRYRNLLSQNNLYSDRTTLGKRTMLEVYKEARKEALGEKNCKAGWRATGMWPINKQKPLRSPLLLENQIKKSNRIPTAKARARLPQATPRPPRRIVATPGGWKTPYHAKDLTAQFAQLKISSQGSRTRRMLFKKVEKAFDEKDLKVVMLETENEALKKRLWDLEHKKKKRVPISPNRKFANIEDIMRSRGQLVDKEDGSSESSESEIGGETQECIVIPQRGLRKRR